MVPGKRPFVKGPRGSQVGRKPGAKAFGTKKTEQKKKGGKLTSVKNQIRAVKRLLAKGGLAPKAVAEQQRRLEQLTDTLEEHKKAEKQRKYAARYHKVRFFERVKIERQISRLEREPAPATATPEAAAERAAKLAALRDDLTYVTHFPKEEKYVSLLRQAEDPEAQAALEAQRARLRAIARARAADAALVAESDEGRALALTSQGFEQAADSDEQDDFFLASDDGGPGAAAAGGDVAAGGVPGKGGKQRQRPLGLDSSRKPAAGNQRQHPQKKLYDQAQRNGAPKHKQPRQQPPADRRQAKHQSLPAAAQQKRPLHTPAGAAAAGSPAQHRHSIQPAAAAQRPQHRPAAQPPQGRERSGKVLSKPQANPAAAAPEPAQPKPGEPVRNRAEGGRKRRKKG